MDLHTVGEYTNKRRRLHLADDVSIGRGPSDSCRTYLQESSYIEQSHRNDISGTVVWNQDAFMPCMDFNQQNGIVGNAEQMIICFGMFSLPETKLRNVKHLPIPKSWNPIRINGHDIYTYTTSFTQPLSMGSVECPRIVEVLRHLCDRRELALEYFCRAQEQILCLKQNDNSSSRCEIVANVFGPRDMFENVGHFFHSAEIFLQDPVCCIRDAPYSNPHVLAEDDVVVTTHMLQSRQPTERYIENDDVFGQLLTTQDLPEASQPLGVRTALHSHQKQALFFMQQKERGWIADRRLDAIWTKLKGPHEEYLNTVTGERSPSKPQLHLGGLVADEMGLGKTLQMISLIAAPCDEEDPREKNFWTVESVNQEQVVSTTLVVVPTSLLRVWADQFETHLFPGTLTLSIFYGAKRRLKHNDLAKSHVVLTTYDVVVAEHRKQAISSQKSCLFSVTWGRIILDEAHYIKNIAAARTRAIYSLNGISRWAVTGTPIQNRLTDLKSIVRFLRVFPFDDPKYFDDHIVNPWKENGDFSAVNKLKKLVSCIAIRRSKGVLHLPERDNQIRRLEFSQAERDSYEAIRERVKEATFRDVTSQKAGNYRHIFKLMNDLRTACSYGEQCFHSATPMELPTLTETECKDLTEDFFGDEVIGLDHGEIPHDQKTPIDDSVSAYDDMDEGLMAGLHADESTKHTSVMIVTPNLAQGPMDLSSGEMIPSTLLQGPTSQTLANSESSCRQQSRLFTKIEALLTDLQTHQGKSVVFSYWLAGLNIVSEVLRISNISFERLDGRMSPHARSKAIEIFRNGRARVMLATISVAGVGIDLTMADQVCLLEPQWNPASEEQALSRVHRMGQNKAITTIRYVMCKSIEENIITLQQRKLRLAKLALAGEATDSAWSHLEYKDLVLLLS